MKSQNFGFAVLLVAVASLGVTHGPRIWRARFRAVGQGRGKLALACLTASLIAGCSSMSGYPERTDEVDARLTSLQSRYFLPGKDVMAEYQGKPDDSERRAYRNDVVYARMMAIDLQFTVFKEAIYNEGITSNLTFEIAGVVTGAAGAVVTGATASRILSALSGGIAGSQTAINKNLYYERTMPALLALMDAERKKIQATIKESLQQDIDVYPLGQALVDLEDYFQAGSIPGAVAEVTQTAGEKSQEAEQALTTLREKSFVDPKAQERVDKLLDLPDGLPKGAAWQILENPPSQLDSFILSAVQGRLGGIPQADWARILEGDANDGNAKQILKMVLVLIKDRSEENLAKWKAAIEALM